MVQHKTDAYDDSNLQSIDSIKLVQGMNRYEDSFATDFKY